MSRYDPDTAGEGTDWNKRDPFGFGGKGYGGWERSYNLNPDFEWARNQGLSAFDFRNRVLENNPAGGNGQNMALANRLRALDVPDYIGSEGWDRWTDEFGQGGAWNWMQDAGMGPVGALNYIRENNPDHWTRQFFMENVAPDRGQDQGGGSGMQSTSDQARSGGAPPRGGGSRRQTSRGGGQGGSMGVGDGAYGPPRQGPRGGGPMVPKVPDPGFQGPGSSPGGPPSPPPGLPQINPRVAQAIMMLMNGRRPGGGASAPMGPSFAAGRRRDLPSFFF